MKTHELFVTRSGTDPAAYPTNNVAVSSTNTYYSKKISGMGSSLFALHLEWTGTPTGAFTLWGSDKLEPSEANDNDWYQITWAPTGPAGAAGKLGEVAVGAAKGSRWKRVKYVNASGSGTLAGRATVQMV